MSDISAEDLYDTVRNALVVLSPDLVVMAVNRAFYAMFKTSPEHTIGRKLYDLGDGQWNIAELRRLLEEIVPEASTVEHYEVEHVFDVVGRKLMVLNARIIQQPGSQDAYFLLAIEDVTTARLAQREAERTWKLAETVVDSIRDPLVILETDMTVVTASRSFLDLFAVKSHSVVGRKLKELGENQWDVAILHSQLQRVVDADQPLNDFLLEDDFPGLGRRVFKINARKVYSPGDEDARLLVAFEDATVAVDLDRHRDVLAAELAHRIKNSLQIISAFVSFEIRQADDACVPGYQAMQSRIGAVAGLYDVIARSSAFGPVGMQAYLEGIASGIEASLIGQSQTIEIDVSAEDLAIGPDYAVPIGLVTNELVTNAIKYAFSGSLGKITIGFQRRDGEVALTVSDNGDGISGKTQGTGMGSRFVDAFVKQLDGKLAIATGSNGTTFTLRLPTAVLAHRQPPREGSEG